MARAFDYLTWAVINQFLGRKNANALGVVTNVKTLEVFPVPQGTEHKDFVPTLLGIDTGDLQDNPSLAEHIIPSIIEFEQGTSNPYVIIGVLTGVSGLEIGLGVRHVKQDLEKAHAQVIKFAANGDFDVSDNIKSVINYKYSKKTWNLF